MSRPKTKRDNAELVRISDHLQYEIKMFLALAAIQLKSPNAVQAIANAVLESFVIHFRVLCDFFYPPNPDKIKNDDTIAADFFDSSSDWDCPELSDILGPARIRAHKEVVHLTYTRLTVKPEAKDWDRPRIRDAMMDVITKFLKAVPDTCIGPKCTEMKRQLLREPIP